MLREIIDCSLNIAALALGLAFIAVLFALINGG